MENLHNVLKKENYKKIKFKIIKTQHLLVKAKINGIAGNFILDTGASSSCVGFEGIDFFQLKAKKSKTKAAGAGATGMLTQLSTDNKLQLGRRKPSRRPATTPASMHAPQRHLDRDATHDTIARP